MHKIGQPVQITGCDGSCGNDHGGDADWIKQRCVLSEDLNQVGMIFDFDGLTVTVRLSSSGRLTKSYSPCKIRLLGVPTLEAYVEQCRKEMQES